MAIIDGTADPNTLTGTIEADVINGLAGDDSIDARTRPTTPGAGIDVVDGGAGIDTLVVDASAETLSVSLGTGFSPTFQVRSLSGNFYVDAYAMERIQITGGAGDDTMSTAELPGTINGGGGIDHWLADLSGLFTGVGFTLGTTTSIAAAGLTSILSIERLSLTTGLGNDTITGAAQADFIATGDGDDVINARTRPVAPGSGVDVVDGGADFDTLIVDATAETQGVQLFAGNSPSFSVRSTSGNFYVDAYGIEAIRFTGGSGDDQIATGDRSGTVNGRAGIDHWLADLGALTSDVVFTLGSTTAIAAAALTSILGLERITLTTGDGDDTITGAAQADTITTGEGDDTIDARTRPAAGSGIDVVDGGGGLDTLIVNAAAESQSVQLFSGVSPSVQLRSNSGNFYVDAYSIETIRFTGGAGADSIDTAGRGGTVNGGAGVDHWIANLGALTSDVSFVLGTTTAIAAAGLTSILGLERLTLTTGAGVDTITGAAQADTIATGEGDDTIDAKTRPAAGSGIDVVDGGGGTDTLVVNAASESQSVQLFSGVSPSFQLRSTSGNFYVDAYSIEKIRFTGGIGNDSIDTADRGVSVNGGGGVDHWIADLRAVSTGITFTLGTTTAIAAAGLTAITAIEQLTLTTGRGDDALTGGAQADTLRSGNGDDTIDAKTRPVTSGAGIDVVDGGGGTDTLVVNAVTETLAVQIFAGASPSFQVRSGSAKFHVDAYNTEILDARTGAGNDTVTGRGFADSIATNAGNDILNGGDGNDSLNGGIGNDTLTGGRGADLLTGGTGAGSDVFDYNSVADSVVVNSTIDSIADFSAGDRIDLSGIDADNAASNGNQAFSLIGAAAFSSVRGQLRAVAGLIEADVNGDGVADFRVLLSNGATLVAADFVL